MAAVKTEQSTSKSDASSNCVDPLDIEQYINPDSFTIPSPSMSPNLSSYDSSTAATPTPASHPFIQPQSEQPFSGPSHQYEQYRQQSSLPVGAVANTFALNESTPYSFGQENYDMIASNSYLGSHITDDYLDLGTVSEQVDLDMDFNMHPQALPSMEDAISPSPNSQSAYPTSSTQHVRAWPGMHQQAAMQAKAQAEAQAQREQQMRQQSVSRSRESSSTHPEGDDPHVEESISRLLNRMRNSSVSSSVADEGALPNGQGAYSHTPRTKKDEEDMDEDERLLASEEGKKLSSKERRQLRNKVSARAFRSRRKEYIGQLEGELAAKAAEADRLRIKNDQLVAENTRLTDLTRMLLSSSHFSNFLDELSANRGTLPSLPQATQQTVRPQQQQEQAPTSKDINPNVHRQNLHVGLAMIPESPYETNQTDSTSNGWVQNNGYDQRVYAVTSIPDEPVISAHTLSGKSVIEPISSYGSAKDEAPEVDVMPKVLSIDLPEVQKAPAEENECQEDVDFDPSDPAFALYADEPASKPRPSKIPVNEEAEESIFGGIATEKAFERLDMIIRDDDESHSEALSMAVMEKLESIRSRMDSLGKRIDSLTGGL